MKTTHTPLAQLFSAVIARDEAERAIDFAQLQAKADHAQDLRDASDHADDCIAACGAWELDDLAHNIESNFVELSLEECADIAEAAIARAEGRQ